ncbi:hypothetical protein DITRI_Ditri20bG0096900 [Diplodiscus trichospermus]
MKEEKVKWWSKTLKEGGEPMAKRIDAADEEEKAIRNMKESGRSARDGEEVEVFGVGDNWFRWRCYVELSISGIMQAHCGCAQRQTNPWLSRVDDEVGGNSKSQIQLYKQRGNGDVSCI